MEIGFFLPPCSWSTATASVIALVSRRRNRGGNGRHHSSGSDRREADGLGHHPAGRSSRLRRPPSRLRPRRPLPHRVLHLRLPPSPCRQGPALPGCVQRLHQADKTPLSLVDDDLKNKRRTPAESPRSYPWKPMLVGVRATFDVADFTSVAYPYRVLPLSTPLKAADEGEAVVAGKGAARQLGGGGGGDRDERAWVSLRSV